MTTLFTSMSLNDYLIYLIPLTTTLFTSCPLMTTLFTSMSLNDLPRYLPRYPIMTTLFTSMSLNDYLIYLDVP